MVEKQGTWTEWKHTSGLSFGEYSYSVSQRKTSYRVLSVCPPGDQVDWPVCQLWGREVAGAHSQLLSKGIGRRAALLASLTASAGGSRYHLHRDHLQQAGASYKRLFCSGWEEAWTLTEGRGRAALRHKISRPRCIKVCGSGLSQQQQSDQIWSRSPRETSKWHGWSLKSETTDEEDHRRGFTRSWDFVRVLRLFCWLKWQRATQNTLRNSTKVSC